MKDKPILFSTPMVQALLEGRKSQTRRIMKPQPIFDFDSGWVFWGKHQWDIHGLPISYDILNFCPYGQTRDILWVRETWASNPWGYLGGCRYIYKSDYDKFPKNEIGTSYPQIDKWKPSIYMPREAARIFLRVTDIHVERLQDITEEDAIAEGVIRKDLYKTMTWEYETLWESINGQGSWDANPWVWVVIFERI